MRQTVSFSFEQYGRYSRFIKPFVLDIATDTSGTLNIEDLKSVHARTARRVHFLMQPGVEDRLIEGRTYTVFLGRVQIREQILDVAEKESETKPVFQGVGTQIFTTQVLGGLQGEVELDTMKTVSMEDMYGAEYANIPARPVLASGTLSEDSMLKFAQPVGEKYLPIELRQQQLYVSGTRVAVAPEYPDDPNSGNRIVA